MRRALASIAVVAVALIAAAPVQAAAPRYILVSGPGLSKPVLLSDWSENLALIVAFGNAPRASSSATHGLARRPRFELALFWGVPDNPVPTNPAEANQFDWFYPARGTQPAVVDAFSNGRRSKLRATTAVLRILAKHHVATRL
jgi:hypothetical protein